MKDNSTYECLKEKLDKNRPSNIKLTSASQIKTYILIETKKGGKLDYFTNIKGKEFDGVQIKPGVFTTKGSIALYKWGRACFSMGVNTVEDAYEIFIEFKQKEIGDIFKWDLIRNGKINIFNIN